MSAKPSGGGLRPRPVERVGGMEEGCNGLTTTERTALRLTRFVINVLPGRRVFKLANRNLLLDNVAVFVL